MDKNKVILLNGYENTIRFSVRSVKIPIWLKYRDSKEEIKQHAVIVLKNNYNKREVIHPISQFIFENWKYKSYNTQKLHAANLVNFLNWLLIEHKRYYKLRSLTDLKFKYGSYYLNDLNKRNKSRGTIESAERTLTLFFYYLAKKDLLSYITLDQFTRNPLPYAPRSTYIQSPFKGVIKPSRIDSPIAHMIPEDYILPFLETVVQVSNPIALGVYFQIFGGLRQGEVVNIEKTDITSIGVFGEDGLILKLRKKHLRPDIKDSNGSSSVKKERNQLVFPISDWLKIVFMEHIENYKSPVETNALFINRDGKAMSGRSYRAYFEKAKYAFLDKLKNSNIPKHQVDSLKLREYKWSTHIGRGIFTNLLAEEANNPYDIALPRGDTNLSSSMVYQGNTLRMKENLQNRMNDLYKEYLPKLIK